MREVPFIRKADDFALGATSHFAQSSSASRFTAGAAKFFILSQSGERPERSIAVDDARARAQAGQRLHDQREAMDEIVARTTIEPHSLAVLAGNDSESIVLNLMQPQAAGR